FAAFTSAFIVRQSAGNWLEFQMPAIFYYSAVIIVLSSVAIHGSYYAFLKGATKMYRGLMILSFVLGIAFILSQIEGWNTLEAMGIELTGNPSGSFVYVISGLHIAHVLGGLAAIILALLHAFFLDHKVTPARKLRFEMTWTYWHFVGLLWIYLLTFFVAQQG
ncbi:MAG: cytochrome c oxidase subunit 3, partial [Bacteroidota bacterium]